MIKANEGRTDRIIRVVVGTASALSAITIIPAGILQAIVLALGIALIATGLLGFCGLYAILGISTCPIKRG